jgi:hypothetical protein
MKRSQIALLLMFGAGTASVLMSGCSSDDSSGGSAGQGGGSAGKGGSATSGGSAGTAGHGGLPTAGSGGNAAGGNAGSTAGGGNAGHGGAVSGGAPGAAGEGGASGSANEGGSGGEAAVTPCGPSSLTPPTAPTTIEVSQTAVLVAAYAAEGVQTYTCQQTGTGGSATYAWSTASVPTANLYGADCMIAATHYAGPHWKAKDGSIVLGTKVRSAPSSTAASIPQLLLSAVAEGTTVGLLTPVTAIQRLDTVGGIAPSTGCDDQHVNGTVDVPYTATYYFYSGTDTIPPA